MRTLRISAISFLNTAPLMWDFEHEPTAEHRSNFEISYTVPSACAKALKHGTADVGIIPAFTYAEIPDLVIIPNVSIAARGPVKSILLISKVPIDQIRTVATDTSSRTSVALTQVILAKWFGGKREFIPHDPDLPRMLDRADAALLIGDAALVAKTTGYHVYDLAEVWQERTGKPFVFAVWAVRAQALREAKPGLDVAGIFQRSRDHGIHPTCILNIARDWAPRLGLREKEIQAYLTDNIYYYLDEPCLEGLRLFFQYSVDCGLIGKVPELRFIQAR
jgi:chorismate dehydratase